MTPEQQAQQRAAAQQLERDIVLHKEARRIAEGGSGVVSRAHVVSLLRALDVARSLNKDLSVAWIGFLYYVAKKGGMNIGAAAVDAAARSGCEANAERRPDGSMDVSIHAVRTPVVRDPGSVM